jgi:hypothetical protein
MRLKPGQAAPKGPVRPRQGVMGPKKPVANPAPQMPIVTAANLQQGKAARSAYEAAQNQAKGAMGSQQALAQAKMGRQNPTPSPGVPSNSIANVGSDNFKRARATFQGGQSAMNAGPKPSGLMGAMSGAGTPQKTQSSMNAAMGASTGLLKPFGAKKGGSVPASTRADGIAKKGKTKGKMV